MRQVKRRHAGIITKIVFKPVACLLKPCWWMMIPSTRMPKPLCSHCRYFTAGIQPSGMEFLNARSGYQDVWLLWKFWNSPWRPPPEGFGAFFVVRIGWQTMKKCWCAMPNVWWVWLKNLKRAKFILFAESAAQKDELWKIRNISPCSGIGTATKIGWCSCASRQFAFINRIKKSGWYGFNTVCFGHLGDGNLHVNILKENISDEVWETKPGRHWRDF